jgi:phenylalanine-4-hydroxylase
VNLKTLVGNAKIQPPRVFTADEQNTWKTILSRHKSTRENNIHEIFSRGVEILKMNENQIPDLDQVNRILKSLTGFQGVLVEGLEEGQAFYSLLANRYFPIGNFIRSKDDISYTPAPDIVHDLYGHLPFFTDPEYSDFCQEFALRACRYSDQPEIFIQFERFFWFTIEFGLIRTEAGLKVFGAGIASSLGECQYALSAKPKLEPFDLDKIRKKEFRIDIMQPVLFVLENTKQLYGCLDELELRITKDTAGDHHDKN